MEKVFFGGDIVTMDEGAQPEAVLVRGGMIAAVGKKEELLGAAPGAERIDLRERTMLPGFIDAHSHLSSYAASFLQVQLSGAKSYDEIGERIRAFIADNDIKSGQWVVCCGYDHNALGGMHPSLEQADAWAPHNPLVLQHASGHVGVFNSAALAKLGINIDTKDPMGGRIERRDGKLTGYMEENAFIDSLRRIEPNTGKSLIDSYAKAQRAYASFGITTVQDGLAVAEMLPIYKTIKSEGLLYLDTNVYTRPDAYDAFVNSFPDSAKGYSGRLRIAGIKIFLDGSPQARTAWMRSPYEGEKEYRSGGVMEDDEVMRAMETAAQRRLQLLAHCNGDAAAEQLLRCMSETEKRYPDIVKQRFVMIHAQLLGIDQLDEVKRLGVIPSFFAAHVYHWGDVHLNNFGAERAANISPAGSALRAGVGFTFHQDAPVISPNMLETVWCAARRRTAGGRVLGESQRISVYEALKAVTVNAAFQYGEEKEKGSIRAGKRADMVILSANPIKAEQDNIPSIEVLETIKDGKTVFSA